MEVWLDEDHVMCAGCTFTVNSFIEFTLNKENLLTFLHKHGVLPRTRNCPECGNRMKLINDGSMFKCYRKWKLDCHGNRISAQCNKSVSQYKYTWFEKHRKEMKRTLCLFVAYWGLLKPPRNIFLVKELDITRKTAVDWSGFMKEVCIEVIIKRSQTIGGPGRTVEIDEAKVVKQICNSGFLINGSWAYGGIDKDSKEWFLVPVSSSGQETLLSTIEKFVLPGTTIVSDCWKKYNYLEREEFKNLIDSQSYKFNNPDLAPCVTEAGAWREVCGNVRRFNNPQSHRVGQLAEVMFKSKYNSYKERIHHLFRAIAEVYDGNRPSEFCNLNVKKETDVTEPDGTPSPACCDVVMREDH